MNEPVFYISVDDICKIAQAQDSGIFRINVHRSDGIGLAPAYLEPPTSVPEGCVWAVTKGGHSKCQPPKGWNKILINSLQIGPLLFDAEAPPEVVKWLSEHPPINLDALKPMERKRIRK